MQYTRSKSGADIIVAQGTEAGGHGEKRATFTLVPEVADYIAAKSPEVLLCAAGGIGDGRGLAAALMLGGRWCCNWVALLGNARSYGPSEHASSCT